MAKKKALITFDSVPGPGGASQITYQTAITDEQEIELVKAFENREVIKIVASQEEVHNAGLLGAYSLLDMSKARWIIVQEISEIDRPVLVTPKDIMKLQ